MSTYKSRSAFGGLNVNNCEARILKITDYIITDLKSRIDRGQDLPDSLTLSSLSEYYDVSLTPVRQAVTTLIEQKFLLKQDNGRLLINDKKAGRSKLKEQVTEPDIQDAILQDIVLTSLDGTESYLREEACSEKYGVGRTVLRGIFSHLAARGVLTHVPRCGWKVHPYTREDMCSYLEIRELLELKALTLSKGKMDDALLQQMLESNLPKGKTLQMDDGLHDYFIDCSGNPYIKAFFETQSLYWQSLFNYAAPKTEMVRTMAQEHSQILDAILKNDYALARKILTQHIRSQESITSELVEIIRSDLK